jgi:glycosyltransferase involved in cell wall biosynthesis
VVAGESAGRSAAGAPLRVLHVSEAYGGGIASAISDYVQRTPDLEHVLLVAHRRGKVSIGDQLPDLRCLRLRTSLAGAIADIRSIVRMERIDIVHAHSSYAGLYARLALSPRQLPLVYSPHCFAFERTDIPPPMRLGLRGLERLLALRTTAFVAVGHRERDVIERISRKRPTITVPHLPPAVRPVPARTTGPLTVGAVGRLCSQKDPRYFAKVVAKLRARHPEVELRWRWIGGGDDRMAAELEKLGVEVTGWMPRSKVLEELAGLDLCLLTSAWEGFPFSVIEASAHHVPVLARSIPALTQENFPNLAHSTTEMADTIARTARSALDYDRLDRQTREWYAQYVQRSRSLDLSAFYHAVAGRIRDAEVVDLRVETPLPDAYSR